MSTRPSQDVTIYQVAKEAGVSKQTVSRVMNNHKDVSPEIRSRVLEVVSRLGYRPNAKARRLIKQRSFTLGVVTAGLKFIGPSRTLNGIALEAEKLDYSIILKETPRFLTKDVKPVVDSILSQHVDGLIWAVPEIGDNRVWLDDPMMELPVPTIFLTMRPRQGVLTYAFDNNLGGMFATEHLIAQGCKNIAHITGPLEWWEARERKRGWETTLQQAGCHLSDRCFGEGDWSPESGFEVFQSLSHRYPEMDAVFVGNDRMALGVLKKAKELGRRIPEDLAVVGFDGLPESGYYVPPLSTLVQDHYKLGSIVVQEIVKIIQQENQQALSDDLPSSMLLPPELIIRESSQILDPVKNERENYEN